MKENETVEKQEEPKIREKRNESIISRRRRKQNKGQTGIEIKLPKEEALKNRKRTSHSPHLN